MAKKAHLKVLFNVATDLGALWTDVKEYDGIHLGGEQSRYSVTFDGPIGTAMDVLSICLKYSDNGKIIADFY